MNTFLKKIAWVIMTVPAVYLFFAWKNLPQKIAIHFDINGNADGYGSKNELLTGIGIITLVSVLVYLLLTYSYKLDRKKQAIENKDRLQRLAFTILVFMVVVSCTIIHASITEGIRFNIRFLMGIMGFLWAVVGNYMYNIKPNYFAGFRISWTLNNEDNWRKTHHVGGKVWFAGGLLLAISSIFLPINILIACFIAVIIVMILVPFIYSYKLHKKHPSTGAAG